MSPNFTHQGHIVDCGCINLTFHIETLGNEDLMYHIRKSLKVSSADIVNVHQGCVICNYEEEEEEEEGEEEEQEKEKQNDVSYFDLDEIKLRNDRDSIISMPFPLEIRD